jgi:hypothetical protein
MVAAMSWKSLGKNLQELRCAVALMQQAVLKLTFSTADEAATVAHEVPV